MKPNINFSPLPFNTSALLSYDLRPHLYGARFALRADVNYLLPFQIIRAKQSGDPPISSATLERASGGTTDVLSILNAAGLSVVPYTEFDVVVFPSDTAFAASFGIGQARLILSDGTYTWTSEWFTFVDDLARTLKIEFYNDANMYFDSGLIDYTTGFKQRFYLRSAVITPLYLKDQKLTEIQGYQFKEYNTSRKRYKFEAQVPEYVADVLRLVIDHDHVTITDGGYTYTAIHVDFEPKDWIAPGGFIPLEISFEIDAVIHSKGTLTEFTGKDFNIDFNADYLI